AQKKVLFDKIYRHYDQSLDGKVIAVWGLAFKPNTDDIREAPALILIEALLAAGAKVQVYDPEAMKETRKLLKDKVTWAEDVYGAVKGADAIALVTEWNA